MSEHDADHDESQPPRREDRDDDLLAEQEGKGYGEDEGERDESLPE
jgi:hypothetical protein